MTTYLDESGTHGGSPVAVMAGYSVLPDDWLAFELDWQAMLDAFCIPALHMAEFVPPAGLSWMPMEIRLKLFYRAVQIIATHTQFGVGSIVDVAKFDRVCRPHFGHDQFSPYGACFLCVCCLNAIWGKYANYGEPIAYMVDEGNAQANHVFTAHLALKAMQKESIIDFRIGTLAFESDDEYGTLQAADFLAYLIRNRRMNLLLDEYNPVLDTLLTLKHHEVPAEFPEEVLQDIVLVLPGLIEETRDFKTPGTQVKRTERNAFMKAVLHKHFPPVS
jgi:hypothetical protein